MIRCLHSSIMSNLRFNFDQFNLRVITFLSQLFMKYFCLYFYYSYFYRHMQRISSCSDTQLNVWPTGWSQGSSHHMSSSTVQEDTRRKLHYHLAAIFPEEQVTQAMQMYPDETNPQKICAAILSMFPKS